MCSGSGPCRKTVPVSRNRVKLGSNRKLVVPVVSDPAWQNTDETWVLGSHVPFSVYSHRKYPFISVHLIVSLIIILHNLVCNSCVYHFPMTWREEAHRVLQHTYALWRPTPNLNLGSPKTLSVSCLGAGHRSPWRGLARPVIVFRSEDKAACGWAWIEADWLEELSRWLAVKAVQGSRSCQHHRNKLIYRPDWLFWGINFYQVSAYLTGICLPGISFSCKVNFSCKQACGSLPPSLSVLHHASVVLLAHLLCPEN